MAHECVPSNSTEIGELSADADSGRLHRIVGEQDALQRIATLVARGVRPDLVFAAVAQEVRHVLPAADLTMVCRHDHGVEVVGGWSRASNGLLDGHRPHFPDTAGALAVTAREIGIRSSVSAPINVDGRAWGVLLVGSTHEDGIPAGTGHRLAGFTELVATAIGNAQAREELQAIADDEAAIRRLAALVTRGEPPHAVYAAIAEQVGQLVPAADTVLLARQDPHLPDGDVTVVTGWSQSGIPALDAGLGKGGLATLVVQTGRPARMDSYADTCRAGGSNTRTIRSAVGVPVAADGHVWGVMLVTSTREQPLPATTEERLGRFTELVVTAIAYADTRGQLQALADERAAFRRVARLIAHAPPAAVFAAVTEETARLLPADRTLVGRYRPDGTLTEVARWPGTGDPDPETGIAATPAPNGSTIVAPIDIADRRWGVLIATNTGDLPLPAGAGARLAGYTELLATAVATAEARAELRAARARTIARVDQTRRSIERDLHDGAQQRLVSLMLRLRAAQAEAPPGLDGLGRALDEVIAGMTDALDELREYGRGIHPAILAEGLAPALKALARRSPVPVELDLTTDARLPESIEVAAYYVVSEALTNTAKHARASTVTVTVDGAEDSLHVCVQDDGRGGADSTRGTGLLGLKDRVEALGGRIRIHSPSGSGTTLRAELPLVATEGDPSAFA